MAATSLRTDLAREAMAAARRVRIRANVSAESPICIFDLVDTSYRDEIELRFKAAPSLEGLYVRAGSDTSAIIIVSSLRPSGRQRLTCAHELGHHVFGHGSSIDEVVENGTSKQFDPNEHIADSFARFLMMPKLGVLKAFADRCLKPEKASASDVFSVASQFGVGFTTLVNHLAFTLRVISMEQATHLSKVTPKRLREDILGQPATGELIVVDQHWSGRAIDLAIGDHVVLPAGSTVEGSTLRFVQHRPVGDIYRGFRVGRGRIKDQSTGVAAFVRVSRFQYQGRSMFRHLEECDDE
ncbi:ImmA/IrrE family metallo-endopeptidase [Sorangium sp. So ce1182]|uniref:ImmA/IrrE family metallo-endopeptidase n=1 Tax=Sorangium sp. So ce1182 TaxID=3133334 RepID=UPI003F604CCC